MWCNMWLVMLNLYDLGLYLGCLRSFKISSDYWVYMGSSMTVRSLRWLPLYLCSYKLIGSATGWAKREEEGGRWLRGFLLFLLMDFLFLLQLFSPKIKQQTPNKNELKALKYATNLYECIKLYCKVSLKWGGDRVRVFNLDINQNHVRVDMLNSSGARIPPMFMWLWNILSWKYLLSCCWLGQHHDKWLVAKMIFKLGFLK